MEPQKYSFFSKPLRVDAPLIGLNSHEWRFFDQTAGAVSKKMTIFAQPFDPAGSPLALPRPITGPPFPPVLHTMLIIGIAGGTGSGKTTVVNKIISSLPQGEVTVIPQDSYYKDSSHIPPEERSKINFDEPAAIEWTLLADHLRQLREGRPIEMPTYSYLTCTRQQETVHVEPRDVVIVEGILVLNDPVLRTMMDVKVFVDADADDRLIRVIARDCVERGRTPQIVIDRYQDVLKPMHERYIEPSKRFADLIVPQGGSNAVAIGLLTDYIDSRLRRSRRDA